MRPYIFLRTTCDEASSALWALHMWIFLIPGEIVMMFGVDVRVLLLSEVDGSISYRESDI